MTDFFQLASKHFEVEVPDSEVVLDYIEFLSSACSELNEIPKLFAGLAKTEGASNFQRNWANMFKRIRNYIEQVVVEHYSRVTTKEVLRVYKPMMTTLCGKRETLPIFTTNYDWVIEEFAEATEGQVLLVDGFRQVALGSRWNRQVFMNFNPVSNVANLVLFKLHGSTSWYKDVGLEHHIQKFPNPSPELAGSRAVVIYPTQVKAHQIQDEPFSTAYKYFRETMMNTELAIIIGFSFRDPVINEIIAEALKINNALKMVVVEPKMTDKMKEKGILFEGLLRKLGITTSEWQRRLRVIKGSFGTDEWVHQEIARTAGMLRQWDELDHWVEKKADAT